MKNGINAVIFAGIILLVFYAGCSNGGKNPVSPDENFPNSITPNAQTEFQTRENSQTHLWGFYDVTIDPVTREISVIPNRQIMFTANVVNFLNGKVSNMGFKINEIINDPDYIDVDIDVTIKHPFPGLPQYNGYDVRGIFMGDGSASLETGSVTYAVNGTDQSMLPDPDDGFGGPDGYTRWYNFTEFSGGGMPLFQYTPGKMATPKYNGTATLNPYKYFADDLQTTENLWDWLDGNPDLHGVFSSGNSNTRNYYIRFPNSKGVKYSYAVIASWKDVVPEAHPCNASEAIAVNVTDNSTVYYVDPSENGGEIKLDIGIWNWGAQLSEGVMDEYTIKVESSVLSGTYGADQSDMTPIGGDENYSTYHVEIPADSVSGLYGNEYWVIVEENDADYSNPYDIPNQAEDEPLAAYFRYDLFVDDESPECPIPHPNAITGSPQFNNGPHTATITSTNLMGTTGISVYLDVAGVIDGSYDITGTDIKNVNVAAGTLDATFDLTGVPWGEYYVVLTNACGETGVSDEPLFIVKEYLEGDIYVSNHHDFDGLPEEGTMVHPFHTVQKGVNAGQPDDLILVDYGLGTYPEKVTVPSGDRYITLRGYDWYSPSGRPCIDGPAVSYDAPTFIMQNVNHMTIQGFKFAFGGADPGWSCMLEMDWCSDITLRDCYFTGDVPDLTHTLVESIQIYWTTDCVVENCLFKNINAGNIMGDWPFDTVQTYTIGGGWNIDLEIKKCEFTDIQNKCPDGSWMRVVAIHLDFDWGGMNIHNNLIHHLLTNSSSSTTGLYVYAIVNNTPLEHAGSSNGLGTIAYNTIDDIDGTGFPNTYSYGGYGIDSSNFTTPTFESDIDVHSNLVTNIVGSTQQRFYGIFDEKKGDYCDIWNVVDGSVAHPWYDPSHEGVFNIYLNPLYENNTTPPYNYHLQSGSPCIGAGENGEDIGCYGNLGSGETIGLLGPED